LPESDQPLAEMMRGYWGRFATSHDPNGNAAPTWPLYAAATDQHLEFDVDAVAAGTRLRRAKCAFWDGLQTNRGFACVGRTRGATNEPALTDGTSVMVTRPAFAGAAFGVDARLPTHCEFKL
jgi:Carboxylesterase family